MKKHQSNPWCIWHNVTCILLNLQMLRLPKNQILLLSMPMILVMVMSVAMGQQKSNTPNIDRLAKQGLRFTNAHCTSATSTPSRYSLLTGEYAWRKKGTGVATGDASAIIQPGRTTIAQYLKKAGYTTGVVGKWHLGLGSCRRS